MIYNQGFYDRSLELKKQAENLEGTELIGKCIKLHIDSMERAAAFVGLTAKELTNGELRAASDLIDSLKNTAGANDDLKTNCKEIEQQLDEIKAKLMDLQVAGPKVSIILVGIGRNCKKEEEFATVGTEGLHGDDWDEIYRVTDSAKEMFSIEQTLCQRLEELKQLQADTTALSGATETT